MQSIISRSEDVFSRIESDNRLFLLKPKDGQPPIVQLLNESALSLWNRIENSALLDDILRDDWDNRLRTTFAYMLHNGFIQCHPPVNIEPIIDAASIGLYQDPWQYQFDRLTLKSPWFVLWEVTERCPLKKRCLFCYQPDEITIDDPSPEEYEQVISELITNKIPWVTLLGGEPLCYNKLTDIISQLRSHRIFVKVITNGLLVTKENAVQLGEAGVNQVAVSLDGLDRETHDLSRGEGAFDKTLIAIETLKQRVPLVSLSLTVSNKTFEQLDYLPEFCQELGITEVYISPLRATSNTSIVPGFGSMTSEQYSQLRDKIASCCRSDLDVINIPECSCGRSSCVIHADGSFSPCPFAQNAYGSIYKEGLATLWSRANKVAEEIGRIIPGSYCFRRHEQEAIVSLGNKKIKEQVKF
ncbi:MAG: radical SAM/SPASM domain-containing protein [Coleofasciculus sp.]|uniref:radical SAM/SPASM domain-containing protein n=1 Tax=Coleofasciculus sp. TaxID=3100458 RepID=UPI003A3B70D2